MGGGFDSPVKILMVLIVALVVLGPKRLPEVGRSLGHGIREFKDSINGVMDNHDQPAEAPQAPPAAGTTLPPPPPQAPR